MSKYQIDFDALDGVTQKASPQNAATETAAVAEAAPVKKAESNKRPAPPVAAVPSPVYEVPAPVAAKASPVREVPPPVAAASSPVREVPPPVAAASSPVAAVSPLSEPSTDAQVVASPAPVDASAPQSWPVESTPMNAAPRRGLWMGAVIAVAAVAALGLVAWLGAGAVSSGPEVASLAAGQHAERQSEAPPPAQIPEPEAESLVAVDEVAPENGDEGADPIALSPETPAAAPSGFDAEPLSDAPVAAEAEPVAPSPREAPPVSPPSGDEHVVTHFRVDSAFVAPRVTDELRVIVPRLRRCPQGVVVTGYTDNSGTADSNHRLSERRARSVAAALVEVGVPEEQILQAQGGNSRPVADNSTVAGRRQNRRATVACR